MNDSVYLWSSILPAWFSAIGTVSAVLVAIFARPIREWWNKPKIIMVCNKNNNACAEVINSETESSDSSKSIKIRVSLSNEGVYTANHAVLNIDSYLEKRQSTDEYVLKEFTPKVLKDHRGCVPTVIAPNLKYYFDVAIIQKADGMMNKGGDEKPKQFYKLFLLGDGKSMQLGKGAFIIPLKFYSSKTKTEIGYLKVYWESNDFSKEANAFGVEMITAKEYKKLKIVKD